MRQGEALGLGWDALDLDTGTLTVRQPLQRQPGGERLAAGSMWTDSGLVFTGPTGKPVDPRADHREWQRLLQKAGVPSARLHDARHTAATILLALGVPARVVMELLGHSQITLTLGTYTHVVPELARDAAARMGDALWG